MEQKLKEFYTEKYPKDKYGAQIADDATFDGLYDQIFLFKDDVYEYVGVKNNKVIKRLLKRLAELLGEKYDYVNYMWIVSTQKVNQWDRN
jgi:hypothetical protein